MAARRMMERENILSLDEVKKLFNKFFRRGHRFFGDLLDSWIRHPQAKKRLFGITQGAYTPLGAADQNAARELAKDQMEERFGTMISAATTACTTVTDPKWLLSLS